MKAEKKAIHPPSPDAGTGSDAELEKHIAARTADLARELEERKGVEAELLRGMRSLRLAIDTIPGLVWSSLPDGHIDSLNQRWLDYTGLTLEQASGWGWQQAIHPKDTAGLVEYWTSILATGTAGEYEARLRRHDGAYRWFLFRGVPLHDEAGAVVKWYGTNTDIEDRKQAEEKLRVSERSLAEGQRLTKTGTWILDFTTGTTDWSVETCRIFGFPEPPPSPHYREFRARVHPDDVEAVDRGLRESFETGDPRPLGYRFLLPDGTCKFIETISEPVKDENGKVLRLMGTIMDVTERRLADEALQSSEILARGQLNALARTLEALVAEAEPDRFLEHVLRTITGQFGAHGSGVWRKDERMGLMEFECAFEGGRLVTGSEAKVAALDPAQPFPGECLPQGTALTGRASVLDDIRDAPVSPWRDALISQGVVTVLFVPTAIAGQVEGVIAIRFGQRRRFCAGELELAQALANQAMLALLLMRLSRDSRQAAVVAERNRMARDIHDTLAQGFTGVIMQLQAAKGATARGTLADAAAHIERAEEMARSSLGEARNSVRALRPRSLRDGNLCRALDDILKRVAADANLATDFHIEGEPRMMPLEWEEDLLRIAQESLTNTIKHARAETFRVTLAFGERQTCLHLADDGRGFDPPHQHDGLGLIGIQERVRLMGGNFILRSQPQRGTEISVVLDHPLPLNGTGEYDHA